MLEAYVWRYLKAYKSIDKIICCSGFMKSKLDRHPDLRGKTVANHNFIDKAEAERTEKKDYVLYFGRYHKEKGIETLVNVCKRLPEVSFVFAGTGALESLFEGVENIKNVGFKSGQELARLIAEARFTVYPSEWYENCPFSVMESISLGTPVLGADIGGIPELICPGIDGELFESGNEAELREKILKMWENPSHCGKLEDYTRFDCVTSYAEKILEEIY
jgi:glycosyltransferase involved in cell wall biosynthesis